ncbi:hypothetical protein PybrP1_000673 [[Pythium] brassicae (nom. inval.)]|nr:hypothetical protein PybrP1_000673 [[Pythium] brassicae (nom. inval.)]
MYLAGTPFCDAQSGDSAGTPFLVCVKRDSRGNGKFPVERSLEQRDAVAALATFEQLAAPPAASVLQRLALVLARSSDAALAARAQELLKSAFLQPALQADDVTKLASIYVVDACLRHKLVPQAFEICKEALGAGVMLDLPAYDALLNALVADSRVGDAAAILKEIVERKEVAPTASTYAPLLLALMKRFEYDEVVELIDHGRSHDISFTLDAYDPLVELGEEQEDIPGCIDGLEKFMLYVNRALEEDGLMSDLEDEEAENDFEIEFVEEDDDDFDEHDDDGNDDDEFR